jgi:hypothetical protein
VDLFGSAMDEADWRIFPVGVAEMRAHTVMKFFFMRNELIVPTDGAKLLEQFSPRWMSVLRDLRVL